MTRAPTTRTGLLETRAARRTAERGTRLLRSKREVLAGEFFRRMREVVEGRVRLDAALREAGRALALARALDGEGALESLATMAEREIPIAVRPKTVWGLRAPEVSAPPLVRAPDARGSAVVSWSNAALDAAHRHEEALAVLVDIATRELMLQRLGEEIRETSRRINGLEHVLLPRLRVEVARIESTLDERERESSVRLARFKARRPGR